MYSNTQALGSVIKSDRNDRPLIPSTTLPVSIAALT
jgi:hypothetical protein